MKKVTAFDEIQDGNSLLITGLIDGKNAHVFHGITKKVSKSDGQEVILKKKGNLYFNFDMYLNGNSWVKDCFVVN